LPEIAPKASERAANSASLQGPVGQFVIEALLQDITVVHLTARGRAVVRL
jgi:hypothetical protein